jgi:hypothetical protein
MRAPRPAGDALDAAYAEFRRKLARAGVAQVPAEGPLALGSRAVAGLSSQGIVQHLLADYVDLRYACALPAPERIQTFTRAVAALRLPAATRTARQSS